MMTSLPFVLFNLITTLFRLPIAVLSTVLFAIALDRLANRLRCYGHFRTLLFGAVSGAIAYGLFNLYIALHRSAGLQSPFLAELIIGYGAAVLMTVLRRLVFAQRATILKTAPENSTNRIASCPDEADIE